MSKSDKPEENAALKRKNESDEDEKASASNGAAAHEKAKTEEKPAFDPTVKKMKMPFKFSTSIVGKVAALSEQKFTPTNASSSGESNDVQSESNKPTAFKSPTASLTSSLTKTPPIPAVKAVSDKVAKVFGDDDDDEEEEMPLEAKMKMRNKGRDTPTSAGPHSYGKTNMGFTDSRALFERKLKETAEELLKKEEIKKLTKTTN